MTGAQFDAKFFSVKEVSTKETMAMKAILNTLVPMVFEHRKYGTLTEVNTTRHRDLDIDTELVLKTIDLIFLRLEEMKKKLNGGGKVAVGDDD
jgi:hypothetical protein